MIDGEFTIVLADASMLLLGLTLILIELPFGRVVVAPRDVLAPTVVSVLSVVSKRSGLLMFCGYCTDRFWLPLC